MRIDIITIFPRVFDGIVSESMIRIAREKSLVDINVHDLRTWTEDKHRQVDDVPYGGGYGMVMKPEPFYRAVLAVGGSDNLESVRDTSRIVLFTPRGRTLNQSLVEEFAREDRIIMLCGRYEGIDERVHEYIATDEVSLGDFILSGGEIPAMALTEAIVRLIPGVLGGEESLAEESFTEGLLEYPHYTRPAVFMGWRVPEVLLSGHHGEIAKWRRKERLKATLLRRPDLLEKVKLSDQDNNLLEEAQAEVKKEAELRLSKPGGIDEKIT
ncbi:MAG TPA: tRNA (guanosine(37)-N1)-methyltransferase TrmD [Anaerolineae bacterium]|nr:tRNA (guanosine(37)-N1)-methyltransferase TrmD [Anaerolineae bacterium]